MIIVLCKKYVFPLRWYHLCGPKHLVKAKAVKLICACKWPSWVNKMWYSYTTENYLTTKSNALLVYFTTTIIIEIITLEGEPKGYILHRGIYFQNRKSIETTKISGYSKGCQLETSHFRVTTEVKVAADTRHQRANFIIGESYLN